MTAIAPTASSLADIGWPDLRWPDSFQFTDRMWGLVLVAALAAGYVAVSLARRTYAVRFTNLELLETVAPRRPGWRRHLPAAALLVGMVALVLAWARPVDEIQVPKERATIVLAIDTSLSMEADDVTPNRIEAAQEAALDFIEELPPQINLGLVTFDGVARVQVTPTTDRDSVVRAINNIELGPATAIGEAILAGLEAISTAPIADAEGEPIPAVLVVMTDGETTVGRPNEAGTAAAVEADIPVATIAFGTERGTVTIDGEVTQVPVSVGPLQDIADVTGGSFFRAESASELTSVYEDIGSSIGTTTEEVEASERFVAVALAALTIAAALSLLWSQRLP